VPLHPLPHFVATHGYIPTNGLKANSDALGGVSKFFIVEKHELAKSIARHETT
jgi:hypothetical protein